MRPPRILIAVVFFVTTVFLTFLSLRSSHQQHTSTTTLPPQTGIQGFFSFQTPFSLFPPNAVISLTHENSTAFLARPAGFGPPLPAEGLKGQVWIGSGFGDDTLRQGAVGTSAEGELGCSDVPGWAIDNFGKPGAATTDGAKPGDGKSTTSAAKSPKRSKDEDGPFGNQDAELDDAVRSRDGLQPTFDDGTDDYLHHPLPDSIVSKPTDKEAAESNGNHADIQSLQEGAEITGKVVLLSRGGCGFLEKVKWAQRRGAIALIVGDDVKGGPLIQMYARGDTSNVTIPSVFTSRTTAHLLSSLVGTGGLLEDSLDKNGSPSLRVQQNDKPRKAAKKYHSNPTFTQTTAEPKTTSTFRAASKASAKKGSTPTEEKPGAITTQRPGWFKSMLFGSGKGKSESDSSRPPSSGQLDWILVDDWKEDDKSSTKKAPAPKPDKKADTGKKGVQKTKSGDDFVIGVQDWRDPDLVGSSGKDNDNSGKAAGAKADEKSDSTKAEDSTPRTTKSGKKHIGGALQDIPEYIPSLRGGSITPGSGEYGEKEGASSKTKIKNGEKEFSSSGEKSKGLLTTIFDDDEEDADFPVSGSNSQSRTNDVETFAKDDDEADQYEGLWVTLTPSSGASPFLDTLLVLVVSPLITLTVVYAMLLVRSRIRRRRWRAPKSVVERLPVRTYQTIASPGSQSPKLPSPTSSSVTTPLLQQAPQNTSTRPRPRSRTTTGIPDPGDLVRVNSAPLQIPKVVSRALEVEKNASGASGASGSSEWKKYMGKQIECVVCLEEYIDGVSRVMSLPCGHEFHADCITPWLTTRRRTCPICKGDVVRSLARGSPASARFEPYTDESDVDIQVQAAESVNNSSTSALPIPRSLVDVEDADLEQGRSPNSRPQSSIRTGSWRSLLSGSLGSTSRTPLRNPQEDRNR